MILLPLYYIETEEMNKKIEKIKLKYEKVITTNNLTINVTDEIDQDEISKNMYSFQFLENGRKMECYFEFHDNEEPSEDDEEEEIDVDLEQESQYLMLDVHNNKREILYQIILATIMVYERTSRKKAEDYAEKIVNMFYEGEENQYITLKKKEYVVNKRKGDDFVLVNINTAKVKFDEESFPYRKNDYYGKVGNMGKRASLTGTIIEIDTATAFVHELAVKDKEDNIFKIYYLPSEFGGKFALEDQYTFYGTIARREEGYTGGLRIDHIILRK